MSVDVIGNNRLPLVVARTRAQTRGCVLKKDGVLIAVLFQISHYLSHASNQPLMSSMGVPQYTGLTLNGAVFCVVLVLQSRQENDVKKGSKT